MGHFGHTPLLPVHNLDDWELAELQWVSPLHLGMGKVGTPNGIFGILKGPPRAALEMGARTCFGQLPESYIKELAKERGCLEASSLMQRLA